VWPPSNTIARDARRSFAWREAKDGDAGAGIILLRGPDSHAGAPPLEELLIG